MFGFFKRKTPPPAPPTPPKKETPPTTTSLVVGDLVICIEAPWMKYPMPWVTYPDVGDTRRIVRITAGTNHAGHDDCWLWFSATDQVGYSASCFRKVQLDHTPAEEAFSRSIRDLVKEGAS